jgi:hypothetical protein
MDITRKLRRRSLAVLVCLACLAGLTPAAAGGVAAAGGTKTLTVFYLAPLAPAEKLCVGERTTYSVRIVDANTDVGISGAAITVNGKSTAFFSGLNGAANAPYTPEKEGPFTVDISASKAGYSSTNSATIKGEAQTCGWRIRMLYEETVTTEGKFFDATCYYKFDNQSFTKDENDNLVLTNGGNSIPAKYGCDTGGLEYPLKVTMSPEISGDAQVDFSGKYSKGVLSITLSALTTALPEKVIIRVEDAVRGGSNTPPVEWDMLPYADVVNQAGVKNWQANSIFDYKTFKPAKSLFFPEQPMKFSGAQATVIVELDKSK